MGKIIKRLLLLALIALLVIGGFQVFKAYKAMQQHKTEEEGRVLLEKIRTVAKLVTVEGQFSEIYDFEDYWGVDWSWFRKKALVRVQATVSVGYDLSNIRIETFPEQKRVEISELPKPTILSIEHDMDYYDLSEGTFNSFTEADFNRINKTVKEMIREQARNSELMAAAEEQGQKLLEMLQIMVESAGWELEYKEDSPDWQIPVSDSLLN